MLEQAGLAQVQPGFVMPGYLADLRVQDAFRPVHLRYLAFTPAAQEYELLLDKGDGPSLDPDSIKTAGEKLLEYFQIGLRLPNKTFWVNLRPDQPDNIIDPLLEKTDIGRIMLETDVQLKKDLARFTDPATPAGKAYWQRLYRKAEALYGDSDMEIPTVTRPWIVPGEILIAESADGAYIYKATLKVMLESDWLSTSPASDPRLEQLNAYAGSLIKELIIPQLTRRVNASRDYARLRQVYYSLVLAQWYKARYSPPDADSNDLAGLAAREPVRANDYFQEYRRSFQQGEYRKEEVIPEGGSLVVRQYSSGGMNLDGGVAAGTLAVLSRSLDVFRRGSHLVRVKLSGGKIDQQYLRDQEAYTRLVDQYSGRPGSVPIERIAEESSAALGERLTGMGVGQGHGVSLRQIAGSGDQVELADVQKALAPVWDMYKEFIMAHIASRTMPVLEDFNPYPFIAQFNRRFSDKEFFSPDALERSLSGVPILILYDPGQNVAYSVPVNTMAYAEEEAFSFGLEDLLDVVGDLDPEQLAGLQLRVGWGNGEGLRGFFIVEGNDVIDFKGYTIGQRVLEMPRHRGAWDPRMCLRESKALLEVHNLSTAGWVGASFKKIVEVPEEVVLDDGSREIVSVGYGQLMRKAGRGKYAAGVVRLTDLTILSDEDMLLLDPGFVSKREHYFASGRRAGQELRARHSRLLFNGDVDFDGWYSNWHVGNFGVFGEAIDDLSRDFTAGLDLAEPQSRRVAQDLMAEDIRRLLVGTDMGKYMFDFGFLGNPPALDPALAEVFLIGFKEGYLGEAAASRVSIGQRDLSLKHLSVKGRVRVLLEAGRGPGREAQARKEYMLPERLAGEFLSGAPGNAARDGGASADTLALADLYTSEELMQQVKDYIVTPFDNELLEPLGGQYDGAFLAIGCGWNVLSMLASLPQIGTTVVADINPYITEAFLPLQSLLIKESRTRGEFLAKIAGVRLSQEQVKHFRDNPDEPLAAVYRVVKVARSSGALTSRQSLSERFGTTGFEQTEMIEELWNDFFGGGTGIDGTILDSMVSNLERVGGGWLADQGSFIAIRNRVMGNAIASVTADVLTPDGIAQISDILDGKQVSLFYASNARQYSLAQVGRKRQELQLEENDAAADARLRQKQGYYLGVSYDEVLAEMFEPLHEQAMPLDMFELNHGRVHKVRLEAARDGGKRAAFLKALEKDTQLYAYFTSQQSGPSLEKAGHLAGELEAMAGQMAELGLLGSDELAQAQERIRFCLDAYRRITTAGYSQEEQAHLGYFEYIINLRPAEEFAAGLAGWRQSQVQWRRLRSLDSVWNVLHQLLLTRASGMPALFEREAGFDGLRVRTAGTKDKNVQQAMDTLKGTGSVAIFEDVDIINAGNGRVSLNLRSAYGAEGVSLNINFKDDVLQWRVLAEDGQAEWLRDRMRSFFRQQNAGISCEASGGYVVGGGNSRLLSDLLVFLAGGPKQTIAAAGDRKAQLTDAYLNALQKNAQIYRQFDVSGQYEKKARNFNEYLAEMSVYARDSGVISQEEKEQIDICRKRIYEEKYLKLLESAVSYNDKKGLYDKWIIDLDIEQRAKFYPYFVGWGAQEHPPWGEINTLHLMMLVLHQVMLTRIAKADALTGKGPYAKMRMVGKWDQDMERVAAVINGLPEAAYTDAVFANDNHSVSLNFRNEPGKTRVSAGYVNVDLNPHRRWIRWRLRVENGQDAQEIVGELKTAGLTDTVVRNGSYIVGNGLIKSGESDIDLRNLEVVLSLSMENRDGGAEAAAIDYGVRAHSLVGTATINMDDARFADDLVAAFIARKAVRLMPPVNISNVQAREIVSAAALERGLLMTEKMKILYERLKERLDEPAAFGIREMLKNAFVHGNAARPDLPLLLFVELSGTKEIAGARVIDFAVDVNARTLEQQQQDALNRAHADTANLNGNSLGEKYLHAEWDYRWHVESLKGWSFNVSEIAPAVPVIRKAAIPDTSSREVPEGKFLRGSEVFSARHIGSSIGLVVWDAQKRRGMLAHVRPQADADSVISEMFSGEEITPGATQVALVGSFYFRETAIVGEIKDALWERFGKEVRVFEDLDDSADERNIVFDARTGTYADIAQDGASLRDGGSGKKGGIDFRALPVSRTPTAAPSVDIEALRILAQAAAITDLDAEWSSIVKISDGQGVPCEQLRRYIAVCAQDKVSFTRIEQVCDYLGELLRAEELCAVTTRQDVKDILVLAEAVAGSRLSAEGGS